MKKNISRAMIGFALLVAGVTACKKEEVKQPLPPSQPNEVQLVVNAITGITPPGSTVLTFIISVKNSQGQEVLTNQNLQVSFDGRFVSQKVQLPAGDYTVTKFLAVTNTGEVVLAAPLNGSARAAQVQQALPRAFSMPNTSTRELPIEVLAVTSQSEATSFGYESGAFGPGVNDPASPLKIKLQAIIAVGALIYDSIPANFTISSWDANGVAYTKDTLLGAGAQEIMLPGNRVRYSFKVQKWGLTDEMILQRGQVNEDYIYTLGGSKTPKRLKREESFLFANGAYQPSGRTVYSYNNVGITQVEYYQKFPQFEQLQYTHKNVFAYAGNKVARINVFDASNTATGFTEFTYNPQENKVINMHQKAYDVETFASVDYANAGNFAEITIDHLYNNGHALEYKMKIRGGNKREDRAISSTGSGEGGQYQYDYNINPFAHMNMPNIFLSNLSKNNMIGETKNYSGNIPTSVVYKIEYTYDAEGYPTEVVKYYKGYISNEHLFKIKTIYTYL